MHLEIVAEKPEKPGRRVPILFVHGMMIYSGWQGVADRILAWLDSNGF